MTGVKPRSYRPLKANAAVYAELYPLYRQLHNAFGGVSATGQFYDIMKRLIAIRNRARKD
jgi:L-ribulokinase